MKKIITKTIFFVETLLSLISVHLVPFFEKKRFAAKLILGNDFFKKNILTKTVFFIETIFFFVTVHLVPLLKKICFASNIILVSNFFKKNILTKTSFFVPVGFLFCLIFVPNLLLAQVSGEFTINALVGNDITPPTTPTMLLVEPTAYDQIDVTWSASTDNFQMGGYVLLRDGNPIATTTLTNYTDTGLIASTTYSYEVYAFDYYLNLSTTSNSLATTTPEAPVVPPTQTSSSTNSNATRVLKLDNLEIISSANSATFWWQTNAPSRYALRWGRNDAYDDGYILNDVYRKEHRTLVSDLEPGTVYLYELIGYGNNGIAITLKQGQFKTEARETLTPPNVQNLRAIVEGNDVSLSWLMPQLVISPKVRIVRSYLGYPVDPYDGAVIYEGEASSFIDKGALVDYAGQYYTVFVIAEDGSVSSGAVVKAKRKIITTATSTGIEPDNEEPFEEELIEIPDFGFSIENIGINQEGVHFDFKSERIILSENEAFVISIPFNSLPKHLKSIIVTLLDPTDQTRSYAFLLRINKDRTAYEATIAPLGVSGVSRLQIEIYDYEREIIGRYRKQIDFLSSPKVQAEVFFPDKLIKIIQPIFSTISLIFLIILLILFLLYRRSKKNEDNR